MDSSSVSSVDSICFRRNDFNLYAFVLFCIIMYFCYILKKCRETFEANVNSNANEMLTKGQLLNRVVKLQDDLFACQTSRQKCLGDVQDLQTTIQKSSPPQQTMNLNLNRVYNPLVPPERTYPQGRFNQVASRDYQQIGFVFNGDERYPLYGRPKYAGRTDRYEYYIIDETRNRLKIPYKSKNDNELYDGDKIHIDVFNRDYDVKIYEYDQFRYDPDVF